MNTIDKDINFLNYAHEYAQSNSGCNKVQVGCLIVTGRKAPYTFSFGTNAVIGNYCKEHGCYRKHLHGNDDKTDRVNCLAIHSEEHALIIARQHGCERFFDNATAYITRYPCERCALLLVTAGIKRVVYGRTQAISEETHQIFDQHGVEHIWAKEWTSDDAFN